MIHVRSLFDAVEQHARDNPQTIAAVDAIAVANGAKTSLPTKLTYSELCEGAKVLSSALAETLAASPKGLWSSWLQGESTVPPVLATFMARGTAWYLVFCAANRLQVPIVALSTDLPDKVVETKRNADIINDHMISLLVADRAWESETLETVDFYQLWSRASSSPCFTSPLNVRLDSTFCFCYTGGTTKASRCAHVSNRMALHELEAYPKIVKMRCEDRVLQQHSLYWGASAYGEIDIALAFGCALIFCEAWDTDGVSAAIRLHGITCSGLVPSVLAALEPGDVPSLRVVFTWGEALQSRVAREWARRVQLIDLLISTECWLSLYADWSSHTRASGDLVERCGSGHVGDVRPPPFKTVPGVAVRLRPLGDSAGTSRSGELLVAGPMISPGYTDDALNASSFESDEKGFRWYCTKDCLEPCGECGYKFAGRADDLVKVGGIWVDTRDIEQRVLAVEDVAEVCICSREVFVVLRCLQESTMSDVRKALPVDFVLHVVHALPRKPGTGKVDRQLLTEVVSTGAMPELEEKEAKCCVDELSSILRWSRALFLLTAVPAYQAYGLYVQEAMGKNLTIPEGFLILQAFTLYIFMGFAWRVLCLSYMILSLWYSPDWLNKWGGPFPGGTYGLAFFVSIFAPNPFWGLLAAAYGIYLAASRGRLLTWPVIGLLGFPSWLRGTSSWMISFGCSGTLRWYWAKLLSPLRSFFGHFCRYWAETKCFLGITIKCGWCKKYVSPSSGHRNPSVDKNWYCKTCWKHYHNHRQCSRCREWSVAGSLTQGPFRAVWICGKCSNAAQVSAPLKPVKVRTVAVLEPLVKRNGRKRLGCDSDPTENPSRLRRRIGEDAVSNGVPSKNHYEPDDDKINDCDLKSMPKSDAKSLPKRNGSTQAPPGKRIKLDDSISDEVPVPAERVEEPCNGAPTTVQQKSADWKLVECATGLTFECESESLLSLDSLHHTKLTSALRRQAGKRLPREMLTRCATLKDLLAQIDRLPVEESSKDLSERGKPRKQERAIWGMMWNSKCQWVFHRNCPLSEANFRGALGHLCERHDALRTTLRDPYQLFSATQQALTVFELFRRYGARVLGNCRMGRLVLACLSYVGYALECVICSCFLRSWPRVGTQEADDTRPLPIMVEKRVSTFEDACYIAGSAGFRFKPPFTACFIPYGKDADEGVVIHLAISHMLSDGFCVVPLLDDLVALVAQQEASTNGIEVAAPSRNPNHRLPPVPSAFAALESRLAQTVVWTTANRKTFRGSGGGGAGGDAGISRECFVKRTWRDTLTIFSSVPTEVVADIRRAARCLCVPDDIAMLALIGIALTKFEGRKKELISMIVPQRDGPSENDMVGLFADVRTLIIATEGLSFAGVALYLHHVVKERLWCAPGIGTQFDMTFVNFEWTDFEARQGFTQNVKLSETGEASFYPLRVAVDQPHRDAWRMRVVFDTKRYNEAKCNKFFEFFDEALHGLLRTPLEQVWNVGSGANTITAAACA